jgi:hypothetical protein
MKQSRKCEWTARHDTKKHRIKQKKQESANEIGIFQTQRYYGTFIYSNMDLYIVKYKQF